MQLLCPTRNKKGENSSFFSFNAEVFQEAFTERNTLSRNAENCPALHSAMGVSFPSPMAKFSRAERKRNTHFCTPALFN